MAETDGAPTAADGFAANGLLSRNVGGTSTFYTFDPQGSVCQRFGSSANLLSTDEYDAFGLLQGTTQSGAADVYGFGAQWGYQTDAETGLLLLTNRYYDPGLARFLTPDPIGQAGGLNLYQYVGNDAASVADPSGLVAYLGRDEEGRYIYPPQLGPHTVIPDPAPEPITYREYLGRLALASMVHAAPVNLMPGVSECEETALENDMAESAALQSEGVVVAPEEGIDVYRGVGARHPGIANARQGIVEPIGGTRTPAEHNEGFTDSEYTSWSTEHEVAEGFAQKHGPGGVVLHDRVPSSELVPSPDIYRESEVLRRGSIRGIKDVWHR